MCPYIYKNISKIKKKKPLHFCRGKPEDTIQGGVSKVADFLNII